VAELVTGTLGLAPPRICIALESGASVFGSSSTGTTVSGTSGAPGAVEKLEVVKMNPVGSSVMVAGPGAYPVAVAVIVADPDEVRPWT
jgi:hypothetical protein